MMSTCSYILNRREGWREGKNSTKQENLELGLNGQAPLRWACYNGSALVLYYNKD